MGRQHRHVAGSSGEAPVPVFNGQRDGGCDSMLRRVAVSSSGFCRAQIMILVHATQMCSWVRQYTVNMLRCEPALPRACPGQRDNRRMDGATRDATGGRR